MARAAARKALADIPPAAEAAVERLVGYNLKRVYVLVRADFRETLGADGLGPRAFSALSLVVATPGITQSDLARQLGIERSGLVAIIDDLERRGYLGRLAVPGDRRVQSLEPTAAGAAAFAAALAAVEAHEDRVLGVLGPDERATLLALLRKLRAAGGGAA